MSEPTPLEQIQKIRNQSLQQIADLTKEPKPTYSVDGQSVSWTDHLQQLQKTVQWCNTMINTERPESVISQGVAD